MENEMNNRQLNEKESLDLITQMIRNTQQKLERGSGIPFLIWGYTTIIVSLVIWYMFSSTADYRWNFLWYLIPVAGGIGTWFYNRKREKGVKTFIDRVIGYIWLTLGVSGFLISVVTMFLYSLPILFIIILLMAIGTALTGLVIRLKSIIVSGFAGIILSLLCLFVEGADKVLVFAGVFLVMMIVPGHILNIRRRK